MCGIAGIVRLAGGDDSALVAAMTARLAHRGPDAEGFHVSSGVALGSRRLAIIDTSRSADQPFYNETGSVAVVFNGAIYNFRALAEGLRRRDHRLVTRCDTEIIAHAWEEEGPRCVERFRGMFAIALFDAGQRTLFLARDRLGKKPLYYTFDGRRLAFASEIKALRLLPDLDEGLDEEAIGEYAAYGNPLGERTIFRAIRRLPPAHYLTLRLESGSPAPTVDRYWDPVPQPDESLSEGEWVERIDVELTEAVRLRLVSDVPLGCFLSSGVDSSLVAAAMRRVGEGPIRTFTIGFREPSHDESGAAARVARLLGSEHSAVVLEPDPAARALDRLVEVFDEPFADESALPTLRLAELARTRVTVALSGDGGDEGFLGYRRYPQSLALSRLGVVLGAIGRRAAGRLASYLSPASRLQRPLDRLSRSGFDLYHHAMGYSDELRGMLRRELLGRLRGPEEGKMAADWRRAAGSDPLARFAYVDLLNYLPDDLLVKVDRCSMVHSLEVRCPLLDHVLVESALQIPTRFKLRGGVGKRILRALLERHLPGGPARAAKRGFAVPLGAWMRRDLERDLVAMLEDGESPAWVCYDRARVAARIDEHRAGGADLHAGLWRALVFHRWSKANL